LSPIVALFNKLKPWLEEAGEKGKEKASSFEKECKDLEARLKAFKDEALQLRAALRVERGHIPQ